MHPLLQARTFREREALAKLRKSKYDVPPEVRAEREKMFQEQAQAAERHQAEMLRREELTQLGVAEFVRLVSPLSVNDRNRAFDILLAADITRFRQGLRIARTKVVSPPEPTPPWGAVAGRERQLAGG
jgi:hypothetical protein